MRKLPSVILAAALASLISGCGILYKQPIYQGNLVEKTAADQLQAGMSKQQVMTLLGTPSIADPFHHERWDYTASERTNRRGTVAVKNRDSAEFPDRGPDGAYDPAVILDLDYWALIPA